MKKQVKSFGEFTRLNEGWNDNPEGFTPGSSLRSRDQSMDKLRFAKFSGEQEKDFFSTPGGIHLYYYGNIYGSTGTAELHFDKLEMGETNIRIDSEEEAIQCIELIKKIERTKLRGQGGAGAPEAAKTRVQIAIYELLDDNRRDPVGALKEYIDKLNRLARELGVEGVNEDFFFPEPYGKESDILIGDQVYVAGMEDTPGTVVDFDEDEYGNPLVIVRIAGTEEGYRESDVYKLGDDDYEEEYEEEY